MQERRPRLVAQAFAHQIVVNSASLTYMVPLGVSAAAAISVGHAVGAGNRALAHRNGSMAIAIGTVLINLIAYGVIGLPIGYTLCFKTPLGIYGLWSVLTLALIFASALVLAMWLKQSRWPDSACPSRPTSLAHLLSHRPLPC